MRLSLIATPALLLVLAASSLAGAQSSAPAAVPTPIPVPTLPAGTPGSGTIQTIINLGQNILQHQQQLNRNNVRGTVSYFKRFDMQVQCGTNCYRNVRLHQGTVINPRGGTPAAGALVDVNGRADANGTIEADQITIQQ